MLDTLAEQEYQQFTDTLRGRFRGVSRRDLYYAVRCLVPPSVAERANPEDIEAYAAVIKSRFDFKAKRQHLTDRQLREAAEMLSEAVDALERRREGYADAEA